MILLLITRTSNTFHIKYKAWLLTCKQKLSPLKLYTCKSKPKVTWRCLTFVCTCAVSVKALQTTGPLLLFPGFMYNTPSLTPFPSLYVYVSPPSFSFTFPSPPSSSNINLHSVHKRKVIIRNVYKVCSENRRALVQYSSLGLWNGYDWTYE